MQRVAGQIRRDGVWARFMPGFLMQFGFFGTPRMTVVVSYYDYSGAASPDGFKQRANALFSSVTVPDGE